MAAHRAVSLSVKHNMLVPTSLIQSYPIQYFYQYLHHPQCLTSASQLSLSATSPLRPPPITNMIAMPLNIAAVTAPMVGRRCGVACSVSSARPVAWACCYFDLFFSSPSGPGAQPQALAHQQRFTHHLRQRSLPQREPLRDAPSSRRCFVAVRPICLPPARHASWAGVEGRRCTAGCMSKAPTVPGGKRDQTTEARPRHCCPSPEADRGAVRAGCRVVRSIGSREGATPGRTTCHEVVLIGMLFGPHIGLGQPSVDYSRRAPRIRLGQGTVRSEGYTGSGQAVWR